MNLIEAWNEAKDGQKIRRSEIRDGKQLGCPFSKLGELSDFLRHGQGRGLKDIAILANDWQIVKEKKKVVIENAIFRYELLKDDIRHRLCLDTARIQPSLNLHIQEIINKPMKITLEYED